MIRPSPSVEFLQYSPIYVQRSIAIGRRLVIIGEADKGETYDPVLVYSSDMAVDEFGGGDLVQAYEDATTFQEGTSIFLMRMNPFEYEIAFSVLEAFDFDLIFMNEVRFDKDKELIKKFIKFAQIKEQKGSLIHGITTLSPDLSYSDLENIFDDIKSLTIENGDDYYETGKYLSLVVNQGEDKDAGAVYAGMLAMTSPEVSPINKTIPSFTLNNEFTKEQILSLRAAGIVCFKKTFKKGITCTSSSCAVSTPGSVHKHISNFRIAQALINQVANELQPFIGRPHVLLNAQNIELIVDAICLEHIGLKRIKDYDYSMTVSELYGTIDIDIELVPIFSVHSITTHTRVRVFM